MVDSLLVRIYNRKILTLMKKSTRPITYLGLIIAFFGVPFVVYLYSLFAPKPYTDVFILQKEIVIFAVMALLLWVVIKGEKKGLSSIGLHNKHWIRSIGRAIGLAIVLMAVLLLCVWILGMFDIPVGGNEGKKYEAISLWTMTLITIRAGVVEEICYRGYIIERLEKISGGNMWIFLIVPVVVFALAHYSQGIAGLVISFVAGLVLAFTYWKTRDLKANILAHFLVDFVPNVVMQLL